MTNEIRQIKSHLQSIVRILILLDDNEKSCCGITLAQCHALVEVGEAGALSLNDLASRMSLDKSTLSRTVNHLVTQGYCAREEDPGDRRYLSIRLTESGAALYERVKYGIEEYFKAIYHAIPEEKRVQVLESVELLAQAIKGTECCQGQCI